MRVFNYPFKPNVAFLKNAFTYTLETIDLKTGENNLSITSEGEYYQDSLNNIFFIFEGEGVLDFQDCLKDYDFSNLYFKFLE
ncbi:hypothetical protein [Helicobacter mesocricetorum]|uniref:hypothetical protein n=1 Tax=Helicobacter mesocricetorum TaxID=87012 RepID=UPI000CF01F6F|nr:hypothetical protein [Helicobacter mesocricetorum]